MAMNILASRLVSLSPAPRVNLAQRAYFFSKFKHGKRESIKSWLSHLWGGKMDPADPNEPPIDSKKVRFAHNVDIATGEEKLLLLAFENGFLDPYSTLPVERNGRGTKDNPIPIESFSNFRIVGCDCEPDQNFIKYHFIYEGEPKRCSCGHWMELVEAPRFWEKIPREDLLQIDFFREMEEEGKLDKLLSGELDAENKRKFLEETKDHH